MEFVCNAQQMKALDEKTIEYFGVSSLVLMERAAFSVFEALLKEHPKSVLILSGTGNNGGDGLALARMLALRNIQVTVLICGLESKMTSACKSQYDSYQKLIQTNAFPCELVKELPGDNYDIIVDALFGIGLSRDITGELADLLNEVNRLSCKRVAIDIPSGIHADSGRIMGSCFHADITYTIAFRKAGLLLMPGKAYCGEVKVCDIGIVPPYDQAKLDDYGICFDQSDLKRICVRDSYGHKGSYGKVGIIAGSENIGGAAIFSASSAYHSGCGYVRVFTHAKNYDALLKTVPETVITTYDTKESIEEISAGLQSFLKENTVLLIGPGLGTSHIAEMILETTLKLATQPLVVDADACNLIAKEEKLQQLAFAYEKRTGQPVVFTPHKAELARMMNCKLPDLADHLAKKASECAKAWNAYVLAKDAGSVLASKDGRLYYNQSGNDALATAGSGDVLAGIVASFLAAPFEADDFSRISAAIYLHGLTGEKAAKEYGASYTSAMNLIECLKAML